MRNKLSGNIPDEIWSLPSLTTLTLSGNLPQSIYQLPVIAHISLSNFTSGKVFNSFNGTLSKDISKLKTLRSLSLDNNNIEGNLPEALVELPQLKTLYLSGNRLSGVVPLRLSQSPQWKSWEPDIWILPQQEGYIS